MYVCMYVCTYVYLADLSSWAELHANFVYGLILYFRDVFGWENLEMRNKHLGTSDLTFPAFINVVKDSASSYSK